MSLNAILFTTAFVGIVAILIILLKFPIDKDK